MNLRPPPISLTGRQQVVLATAFRRLLDAPEPVPPERIAETLGCDVAEVVAALDPLDAAGRTKRDASGGVLASLGLTLTHTRHTITIDGVRRNTWCALDAVGILGALTADGAIQSLNPAAGREFQVTFRRGRPHGHDPAWVLFVAESQPVASVVEQWCPLVNFFPTESSALSWAGAAHVKGGCFTLEDATDLGTELWRPLLN